MLSPRMRWWGFAGLVGILCLLAIVLFSGGEVTRQPTDPSATSPTTPSIPEDLPEDDFGVDVPPRLAERVQGFLEAYYLVNPTDTPALRRERVRPFVGPAYLSKLPLQLTIDPDADQLRRSQSLTLRGEVVMEAMSGSAGPGIYSIVVAVPVIQTVFTTDGRSVSASRIETITVWSNKKTERNPQGRWLLQSAG